MVRIVHIIILSVLFYGAGFSQLGIGTDNPEATLDVREQNPANPGASTGISFPQVDRLPTAGNRIGQVVFLTTDNRYHYYNGSDWACVNCHFNIGAVKYGFQTDDHDGWINLNGRTITSLTSTQQTRARDLGFPARLPNARDRLLKNKSGEDIASLGGTNQVVLTRANLPNVNFNGTRQTNNGGAHTHSYDDSSVIVANQAAARNGQTNTILANFGTRTNNRTTGNVDGHSHTVSVSSGGSGEAIEIENQFLSVNVFVYLGD